MAIEVGGPDGESTGKPRTLEDDLRERIEGLAAFGVEGIRRGARAGAPAHLLARKPAAEPELSNAASQPAGSASLAVPTTRSQSPSPIPGPGEPLESDLFVGPSVTPQTLDEIRAELGDCRRCKLADQGRSRIVFGVGSPTAEIVFVGEGPGQEEDIQGIPFVGKAGQLLTKIIEEGMGLRRADVYICNIVKCRPPGNRDPERDEVQACSPFLEKQIRAIRPKVLVALGKPATSTLLGRTVAITRIRGEWQSFLGIPLMPTYHPAYVLRNYTPETRGQVWEDMKKVLALLGRAPAGKGSTRKDERSP